MMLLPVASRELRVAARRNKTYWLRFAAAAAALFVCAWVCFGAGRQQPAGTLGKSVFSYLSILAFAYCLLVGPFITADSVSEEKREGTIGLLFLTELRGLDVVLGKWLATSLAGFYGLLGILPALGLPLLMGGVTPDEYWRTALAVVNAVLFSLAAGMCVSCLSRDQPKAVMGSVLVVLGLSGLLPGLAIVGESAFFTRQVSTVPAVFLASPAYTGYLALDANYRTAPQNYWMSLATVHGLTWLFMVVTLLVLGRVWRQGAREEPAARRWLLRLGYTSGWKRVFKRRLDKNPVYAVAARLRWPHFVFWLLVALVAINVYWLTYGYRRNLSSYQFHQYFSHALVFTNRVWITVMACRFFLEARRTGALELLLTTPLPVRTLLRGHGRALWRLFALPIGGISLLHVFYVMGNWRLAGQQSAGGVMLFQAYVMGAGSSLTNFLTDVLALCYVGAWLSVASRKSGFAVLYTFALVILVPWTIGYFLPGLSNLMPAKLVAWLNTRGFAGGAFRSGLILYPLGRSGVWVLKNLILTLWARHHLRRHFRAAAVQTYRYDRRRFLFRPPGVAERTGSLNFSSLPTPSAPGRHETE